MLLALSKTSESLAQSRSSARSSRQPDISSSSRASRSMSFLREEVIGAGGLASVAAIGRACSAAPCFWAGKSLSYRRKRPSTRFRAKTIARFVAQVSTICAEGDEADRKVCTRCSPAQEK